MPEFLKLLPPNEALRTWLDAYMPSRSKELVASELALGRVTAEAIIASQPLPAFSRSTVDGFALRAEDSFGASDTLPVYLQLIGEIPMGAVPTLQIGSGQCALIHTGGMLPVGANAVVMLELTQHAGNEIEVLKAVAVDENVIQLGEDVSQGDQVIPNGRLIRPAEIGGLMALGLTQVSVVIRPRVGIISSGDEVVNPWEDPRPGQVRDINAYSLAAMIEAAGGEAVRFGIVPDSAAELRAVAARALQACDLVVITAGSSASTRDLTATVLDELGPPGVLVHGVNVRPGKPTILAVCNGKPLIGLPGNPVSAMVISRLFIIPAVLRHLGVTEAAQKTYIQARISTNLPSQAGREDWIPVRLVYAPSARGGIPAAEPQYGKSNLIFSLVRADGLIRIPADATGLHVGDLVAVENL